MAPQLQGRNGNKVRGAGSMKATRKRDFVHVAEMPPEHVIFGQTTAMKVARDKLERVADTPLPVLLRGESGTGKDIFARLLHTRSRRSCHAFVHVTCPAIPNSLIESELFGYEKGAFTGAYATKCGRAEMAHLGTLFLDDIGGLESASQAKLLQLVQDGTMMRVGGQESRKVDTRLICAANGDLRRLIADGGFRLDLFFRISAVTIDLPPLRERSEDLPTLIDYFLERCVKMYQVEPKPISRDIVSLMARYNWPGNIRQLENLIRSYALLGNEEALIADLTPPPSTSILSEIDVAKPVSLKAITKSAKRELEREIILKVLQANGWNRQKAARWLNISYRSLLYKMQEVDAPLLRDGRRTPEVAAPPSRSAGIAGQLAGD
jgi:two-component system, NtrC family, response regulator AtoC